MMTAGVLLAVIAVMVWTRRAAKRSGATGVRPYELIYLFFSSAFLGDCFETVFVWLTTGVLMSRSSLLYAPLSLVWGLGAVLATLTLYPLASRSAALLFTCGAVLGGGFEYLTSLALELTLHRVFWDYSRIPFNLAGRTNLLYSLFWGAAAVFWVRVAAPRLLALLHRVPPRTIQAVTMAAIVLLTADMTVSSAALLRMRERSTGAPPDSRVERLLDTWYSDEMLHHHYQNMAPPPAA